MFGLHIALHNFSDFSLPVATSEIIYDAGFMSEATDWTHYTKKIRVRISPVLLIHDEEHEYHMIFRHKSDDHNEDRTHYT